MLQKKSKFGAMSTDPAHRRHDTEVCLDGACRVVVYARHLSPRSAPCSYVDIRVYWHGANTFAATIGLDS